MVKCLPGQCQVPSLVLNTHLNKKGGGTCSSPQLRQHQPGGEEHPGVHGAAVLPSLVSSRFQNETLLQRTRWLGSKAQSPRLASGLSLHACEHRHTHTSAHAPPQTYSLILTQSWAENMCRSHTHMQVCFPGAVGICGSVTCVREEVPVSPLQRSGAQGHTRRSSFPHNGTLSAHRPLRLYG